MQPGALSPLKEVPLWSRVCASVRDATFAGVLNPGVSPNTVREALLRLEQTGPVARTPNKQTVATPLSAWDIRERVGVSLLTVGSRHPRCARTTVLAQREYSDSRPSGMVGCLRFATC